MLKPIRSGSFASLLRAALAGGVLLLLASVTRPETLADFLKSDKLEDVENPVPITYLLEQAPPGLDPALRDQALAQAKDALRHQTSAMNKIGEEMAGAMGGPTMRKLTEQMRGQATLGNLAKQTLLSHFGIHDPQPGPTQRQTDEIQQEMRAGMVDPWIRGIESARALENSGNAQAAGRFYINCIQSAPPDFLADTCLNGILGMGPLRAQALLAWMADHAEDAAIGGLATNGRKGDIGPTVIWLRGAALRGLGALAGSGALSPEQAAAAIDTLLRYARGKDNQPYFADAAEGLGRSGDARALPQLRDLARADDPTVAQAALRALAVGLHDAGAAATMRRYLDDRNPAVQLRAADALIDAGDEAGFAWAREVITSRRDPDSGRTDLRPRVVRDLVERGDARSRQVLQAALEQGAGNDFLHVWIEIGLLQLGDRSRLEPALAAIGRHDWALDRPGIKQLWQRIQPLLQIAAQTAMGMPLSPQQVAKVVVNFALAERARAGERAADRDLVSLQVRLQVCDALASVDDPRASAAMIGLLVDSEPAVRLNAAKALLAQPGGSAIDGLVRAYHADFGQEEGSSRTPEVRAALLRAALLRAPADERTRALVHEAAGDPDPGLRFMGLLAQAN